MAWDQAGIPHINAPTAAEACRAFGWAQMQIDGERMLRGYGIARGRAAEYWGPDYLESDRFVWTVGIPARADRWLADQPTDFQGMLAAFALGINQYARAHPAQFSTELTAVLPIEPSDVLSHLQKVVHFGILAGEAGTSAKNPVYPEEPNAIAFKRAGKAATLVAAPRFPWKDRFPLVEAHIRAADSDVHGYALLGLPSICMGFNRDLAWVLTPSAQDGSDLFSLEVEEGGYRFDGELLPLATDTIALTVRGLDGATLTEDYVLSSSVHGPIVQSRPHLAVALRVVGLERSGLLRQWWDMGRARNLAEFEDVLERMQMPAFAVLGVARQGGLLAVDCALTPKRPDDDRDWSGMVAGSESATLWKALHSYAAAPRRALRTDGWLSANLATDDSQEALDKFLPKLQEASAGVDEDVAFRLEVAIGVEARAQIGGRELRLSPDFLQGRVAEREALPD